MDQLEKNLEKVYLENRMKIFQHLTYDKLTNNLNTARFKGLLDEYYDEFVAACEYVKQNIDKIASVSCYTQGGKIYFIYEPIVPN